MWVIMIFPLFMSSFKLGWLERTGLLTVGMLSLVVMHSSCRSSPNFTYPEVSNITEIRVMDIDRSEPIKIIRDQHQIDAIVKFINRQRSGWSPPRYYFPATKMKLYLYSGENFKGHFGIDKSSFSMQREGRYDSKPASEEEVQEILNLIGIEKRMLEWN